MSDMTRQKIFAQAAKKLRQDFGELSTIPHNALKGHEAEKIIQTFLSAHLPKRSSVGAGFIIDPHDALSKQTDIIIYDAMIARFIGRPTMQEFIRATMSPP